MNFQKFSLREPLGGNPPDPQSQNLKNRPPPCSACISGFHGSGHPPTERYIAETTSQKSEITLFTPSLPR